MRRRAAALLFAMRFKSGLGLSLLAVVLAACVTASPTSTGAPPVSTPALPTSTPNLAPPVQPVTGLPSGTDGYPWWNDTVFYEVFVRSFFDSDADGIGDLNGLIAKLDYLNDGDPNTTQDLGVTGLWLMPIHPSPTYHGYDVADYYTVRKQYGSLDNFKRLMAEAHRRGLRVIIDLVPNHTSKYHSWFQAALDPDSEYRDWYVWSPTKPDPARGWHPSDRGDWYYGFFWEGMPDLNYANPAVGEQMKDVARFWLTEMGADGFRIDAVKYLFEDNGSLEHSDRTHEWLAEFRSDYKAINPEAVTVGEVWDDSALVEKYVQGDELDLGFSFDLAKAILMSAATRRSLQVTDALRRDLRIFRPLQFATFITNHDQDRVMSVVGDDVNRARTAAAMLLTAPGVPFLYYGEEIGLLGRKPDEHIRAPMQWTPDLNGGFTTSTRVWEPVNKDYPTKNVAAQTDDPKSLLSFYRALIHLRNNHAALRVGQAAVIETANPTVYALLRSSPQEKILTVINLGKDPVQDYALGLTEGPLKGAYSLTPLLIDSPNGAVSDTFAALAANAQGGLEGYQPAPELPPYSVLIFQVQAQP
jgi:glycosidase